MDLKEIQDLIRFVSKSGVTEVELERDGFKIVIKAEKPTTEYHAVMQQPMMMQQPPSQTYQDFQFVQFMGPVRRATYGPMGTNNDYTMQVNALIQRGQRQVVGGIHTVLGDPAPGVPKVFQVWY